MTDIDVRSLAGASLVTGALTTTVRDVLVRSVVAPVVIPVPAGRWQAVAMLTGQPAHLAGPEAVVRTADTTLPAPGNLNLVQVALNMYRPHAPPTGEITATIVVYRHNGLEWGTWAYGSAGAAVPLAGAASTTKRIGFSGMHLYSDAMGEIRPWWQTGMDRAAEMGATFLRQAWPWFYLEENGAGLDPYHQTLVDAFVADAAARGLGVVPTLGNTACYASSQSGKDCNTRTGRGVAARYPPTDQAVYRTFVKAVCDRWSLEAIEPSNEPNHPTYGGQFTPADRVEQVDNMRTAVQSSDNPVPVLGGVLSESDAEYLQDMYDVGLAGACDAICVHPYPLYTDGPQPFATYPSWQPQEVGREKYQMAEGLETLADVATANGEPGKAFWITEYGYNISGRGGLYAHVTDTERADYLDWYIRQAARISYLNGFAVFALVDPINPAAAGYGWGICDRRWNRRQPTFDAVRDAVAAVAAGNG